MSSPFAISLNAWPREKRLQFTQYAGDNAADIVFWINPADGRLEYANEVARRPLGFTREELLRMNITDINPAFDAAKLASLAWKNCIRSAWLLGKACTAPALVRTSTSRRQSISAEYQDRQMLVAIVKDITERKWAETQIRQARDVAEAATRTKSGLPRQHESRDSNSYERYHWTGPIWR